MNYKKALGRLESLPFMAASIYNPGGIFISYGDNSVRGVLFMLVELLLTVVGIIAIFFIVYGGFQYITSGGNEEVAEAGKKTLTNAIIGLVIVILSYTIVTVVINALKGNA